MTRGLSQSRSANESETALSIPSNGCQVGVKLMMVSDGELCFMTVKESNITIASGEKWIDRTHLRNLPTYDPQALQCLLRKEGQPLCSSEYPSRRANGAISGKNPHAKINFMCICKGWRIVPKIYLTGISHNLKTICHLPYCILLDQLCLSLSIHSLRILLPRAKIHQLMMCAHKTSKNANITNHMHNHTDTHIHVYINVRISTCMWVYR